MLTSIYNPRKAKEGSRRLKAGDKGGRLQSTRSQNKKSPTLTHVPDVRQLSDVESFD